MIDYIQALPPALVLLWSLQSDSDGRVSAPHKEFDLHAAINKVPPPLGVTGQVEMKGSDPLASPAASY